VPKSSRTLLPTSVVLIVFFAVSALQIQAIIAGSVCGVLLILALWIYCACCRKSKKGIITKRKKEDAYEMKETRKREEKQDARRGEREDRSSALRSKYGLNRPTNGDGFDHSLIAD
jgi:hypothetical protein